MARRRSAAGVEGLVVILTVLLFASIAVQAAGEIWVSRTSGSSIGVDDRMARVRTLQPVTTQPAWRAASTAIVWHRRNFVRSALGNAEHGMHVATHNSRCLMSELP